MDDLGYEGRGRRILELERELSEARRGILECQTRILVLERELAEAKKKLSDEQIVCQRHGCMYESFEQDRDEAHAAIRALRDAGQKFADGDLVDEDGNVSAAYNYAYRGWYAVLSGEHAPAIARASEANIRRAMGQ